MSQVQFIRWCVDAKGRTPISVEPSRVDCTEWFTDAFKHGGTDEQFPAATKIIMKGKQEYVVQGTVQDVVSALRSPQ